MDKIWKYRNVVCFYAVTITLFLLGTLIGNRAVTVISENIPITRKHTVIIDAGHGGEDGGAISCSGRYESRFNLEIALRLDDLLHLLGVNTQMIRKTDTAVYTKGETLAQKKASDLKQRVKLVNDAPNSVLVSIHQNNFSDAQYRGAQVFYGAASGSERLAKEVQDSFLANLNPESHRQIKQRKGIYLLEKTTRPSILVECGFLSNAEEEAQLNSPAYQKKICCILASSLSCFCQTLDRTANH